MRRALSAVGVVVLVMALTAELGTAALVRRSTAHRVWNDDRVLTVLVLGSDMGPPSRPGNPLRGRADAIHLVAVDTRRERATIVDIPRDSYIAGDKVNGHMASGGPQRITKVIEDYSGLHVDHWVVTSFKGLRGVVNALGGVPVDLPGPMNDAGSGAVFKAGKQRFDGKQALAFSRNRYDLPNGDFGRTRNQGRLLRAIHKEVRRRRSDLPSLTRLAAAFSRNTESNIPPRELLPLASLAVRIKPRHVKQVSLSGGIGTAGGASIVNLNPADAFRDIKRRKIGR
ncbi:MAG: LCP family protein [Egibacteraceae bacterium]